MSPTLSAITAGFLGSSSGIPASTLPTKSAPTSAAFVYIPPPTRAKRAIDEAAESSSLYPTVQEINNEFSFSQKAEVLKNLWELIAVDGIINHYEENLYFKIAELIKIRRSLANQIKQKNNELRQNQ